MIALDAMGGDHAPYEIVIGAINAAKKGVPILLFGDEARIIPILNCYSGWQSLPIELIHCTQAIGMGEIPTASIIKKKDASLVRALNAVCEGRADAVVTAGNSGAALIGGTLILKRVPGISRPAIGEFLPTKNGALFCLDLGANTDCKPHYLYQFALMGHVYVSLTKKINSPRIALLSNGAEAYKGSKSTRDAYQLLERSSLNFIGNLEARDIFETTADILVCDGFVGNVMLKSIQGTLKAAAGWMKEEVKKMSWWQKFLFACNKNIFKKIKSKTDYRHTGASLLLGVNAPLLVAHGCSNALAIENALIRAQRLVEQQFISQFNTELTHAVKKYSMRYEVLTKCDGVAGKIKQKVKSVLRLS